MRKKQFYALVGSYLLIVGLVSLIGVSLGLSVYSLSVTPSLGWSWFQPHSPLWLFILLLPFYLLQTIFSLVLNVIYTHYGVIDTSVASFLINYLPALICIAAGAYLLKKYKK